VAVAESASGDRQAQESCLFVLLLARCVTVGVRARRCLLSQRYRVAMRYDARNVEMGAKPNPTWMSIPRPAV
jgi:hypothetical protein